MILFKRIFRRKRIYLDLSESIGEHIAERTDELVESGIPRNEAERAARLEFGNSALVEQRGREVWQWPGIENLLADVRIAARQLKKTPVSTTVALLIIALGIGASTAVFSIVNSVLLRPFAFEDPGRLVVWREVIQEMTNRYGSLPDNYLHYLYLKANASTVADAAIVRNTTFAAAESGDHPRMLKGLIVSPNFFSVLGIAPLMGRTFLPEEALRGRDNSIVISWRAWQELFRGDADAIGKTVETAGQLKTVVGVLPRDFDFPVINEMPEGVKPGDAAPYAVFEPFAPDEDQATADDAEFGSLVIARLKPGVSARQAEAELDGMLRAYSTSHHLSIHLGAVVAPFSREVTGNIGKALWLLLGAVLSVMLIACVNLSSLQLARSILRERDNAVRAALGAGKSRLFQATLMESLLLAFTGGAAGVGLAFAGVRMFQAIAPANLPRLQAIEISWPVLLFACGISVLTAVLSGIFPAVRSLRADPQRALQSASTRVLNARRTAGVRRLLVTIEIALTVVLLTVSSLMVRSFSRVLNEHHEFNPRRVTVAEVDLLSPRYAKGKDGGQSTRAAFVERLLTRLRANPGVESAASTSQMPLTGDTSIYSMYRPDHPLPDGEAPTANLRNISPGYFAAVQTPLVSGTEFTDSERENPRSAIISQRAALVAWPGEQPVGKKVKVNGRVYTVTGIAADARIANLKENTPVVYLPFWHDPRATIFFLVRSSQDFEALAPAIRRQIWEIDPDAAIPVIKPLDVQLAESVAPERLQTMVLSAFGAAALVLAILGVYGVLAYSVSVRMPEFGVRLALGSSKLALIRLVLLEASTPVLAGVAVGLIAAFGVTRAIRSQLYETSMADPAAIAASIGLLLFATLLAAFLPAFRAARMDPMRVLRQE